MPKEPTFMVIAGTFSHVEVKQSVGDSSKGWSNYGSAIGIYQIHVSTPQGTVWQVLHDVRIKVSTQLAGLGDDLHLPYPKETGVKYYPWWDKLLSIGTPQFWPNAGTAFQADFLRTRVDNWYNQRIGAEYQRRKKPFEQATVYETQFFTSTNPPKHSFPLFDLDY
jgi:hypothetical protein